MTDSHKSMRIMDLLVHAEYRLMIFAIVPPEIEKRGVLNYRLKSKYSLIDAPSEPFEKSPSRRSRRWERYR